MGCKVSYVPLGELAELESGGTPSKKIESYWGGSIPWVSAKTLVGDTVYESDLTISKEGLKSGSKLASKGSLLLLTRGSGLFKRIPLAIAGKQVAYNQDIKCINANAKGISNRYLFYALKALEPDISAMLETTGIGAGKLATDRLKALPIPVLAEDARAKVTSFADCIYGKMSLNAKLNGYLEELLLAKCADLENAVEESCTVGDYCKRIYSGGTPSTKIPSYWNGTLPWLSSGETRARFIIGSEKTITPEGIEGSSTKLANRGSIVMASAGQGFTRGQTSMLLFDTYVNQSVVVMVPEEKCGSYLLFALAARYEELRAWSDSMSTRGSLSGKILRRFALPCLTKKQLERFESLANPLIRVIESNLRESKSLAELRDALLPKLMSGEIDVSKVDLTQLNSHLVER